VETWYPLELKHAGLSMVGTYISEAHMHSQTGACATKQTTCKEPKPLSPKL